MSPQESVTIKSINRSVFNHYERLFDFVSKNAEAWDKYGEVNFNNNFEFFPSRLITPLRTQLQFQEIMVHTQLFQTFVEERKRCIQDHDKVPTAALQIAHWGQRIWRESANKKNKSLFDTLAQGLTLNRNNPVGRRSSKSIQSTKKLKSVFSRTWN